MRSSFFFFFLILAFCSTLRCSNRFFHAIIALTQRQQTTVSFLNESNSSNGSKVIKIELILCGNFSFPEMVLLNYKQNSFLSVPLFLERSFQP